MLAQAAQHKKAAVIAEIRWDIVRSSGWIASKIMGTDAQQGALANVVIGIAGALLGGFLTHRIFGANLGNNGVLASFAVALVGSCLVIFLWKAVTRRRA